MTLRERVERDFGEFCAWLRAQGVGDPYFFFSKETWDFMSFQRAWAQFNAEQQRKAQAEQANNQILERLKDPAGAKATILAAVSAWSKEDRQALLTLLTPPPLEPEPAGDAA